MAIINSLIRNPLIINPLTIWIRGIINYIIIKSKNPTVQFQNNVIAKKTNFGKRVTLYNNIQLHHCSIGDFTYISDRSLFAYTTIGKFCSIAPGVMCGMGNHPVNKYVSTHPMFYSANHLAQISLADKSYYSEYEPVEVGNDVWIGANAIIKGGVKIGDGAIVGAGAVVTKDIPPFAIVGGVPARVIKYRFDKAEIDYLLGYKWWDKDLSWLRSNWKEFHDIKTFKTYGSTVAKPLASLTESPNSSLRI